MAHLPAVGEDGFEMWKVLANIILNKKKFEVVKGSSSAIHEVRVQQHFIVKKKLG